MPLRPLANPHALMCCVCLSKKQTQHGRCHPPQSLLRHAHFRDLSDTVEGGQAGFLALLYDRAGRKAETGEDIDACAYLVQADHIIVDYTCRRAPPVGAVS